MSNRVRSKRKPLSLVADACGLIAIGLFVACGYFVWPPLALLFGSIAFGAVTVLLTIGLRNRAP